MGALIWLATLDKLNLTIFISTYSEMYNEGAMRVKSALPLRSRQGLKGYGISRLIPESAIFILRHLWSITCSSISLYIHYGMFLSKANGVLVSHFLYTKLQFSRLVHFYVVADDHRSSGAINPRSSCCASRVLRFFQNIIKEKFSKIVLFLWIFVKIEFLKISDDHQKFFFCRCEDNISRNARCVLGT